MCFEHFIRYTVLSERGAIIGVRCSCKHSPWLESLLVCLCKVSAEPANCRGSFQRHEEHAFHCQATAVAEAPVSLRKQRYEDACKTCVNTAIWFHAPLFFSDGLSALVRIQLGCFNKLMFCHCAEWRRQDELPLWYRSSHLAGRLIAQRGTLRASFIHCVCFVLSFVLLIDLKMIFFGTLTTGDQSLGPCVRVCVFVSPIKVPINASCWISVMIIY